MSLVPAHFSASSAALLELIAAQSILLAGLNVTLKYIIEYHKIYVCI